MKITFLLAGWVFLMMTACSDSESVAPSQTPDPVTPTPELPSVPQPFLLTQTMLDAVTTMVSPADSAITGNSFRVRTDGSDRNIKDIYSSKPLNRSIQVGDIIVIRSFYNEDGSRGQLEFVDLMVRREAGFNATGGDFEYFRIDFDATTNYVQHPNGLVPTLSNSRDRGLDIARAGCINCHRFAGGDFLFTTR